MVGPRAAHGRQHRADANARRRRIRFSGPGETKTSGPTAPPGPSSTPTVDGRWDGEGAAASSEFRLVSWDDAGEHDGRGARVPVTTSSIEARARRDARAPRANAAAKDSAWVSARPLEALQSKAHAPINELLLSDEGKILEGSQTNFYAIVDGIEVTGEIAYSPGHDMRRPKGRSRCASGSAFLWYWRRRI